MAKKLNINAVIGISALGVGGILLFNYLKKKNDQPTHEDDTPELPPATPQHNTPAPAPPPPTKPASNGYPVVYKKYSDDAKLLQRVLGVKDDGVIGSNTLKAWKKKDPSVTERFKIPTPAAMQTLLDKLQGIIKPAAPLSRTQKIVNATKAGKSLVALKSVKNASGFIDALGVFNEEKQLNLVAKTKIAAKQIFSYGSDFFYWKNARGITIRTGYNDVTVV